MTLQAPAQITEAEKKVILTQYRELLKSMRMQLQKGDRRLIRLAFEIAYDAHRSMRRKSGEPYILHPLAVAKLVASEIGLGTIGVICALLHDTVEDTEVTLQDIEREFGKPVAEIIDGLTKISVIFDRRGNIQAENIRKIMLTLSKDVRVVLIKLADRLHNLRTMDHMPRSKQLKTATETSYLYIPLAHRLGLNQIKTELEDLVLKISEPKVYRMLERKIRESRQEREQFIQDFIRPIKERLDRSGLKTRVFGRLKSIASIWRKMKAQQVSFEEVYDKFAIRIIVDSPAETEKSDCWKVYSIVSEIYRPNPDRLRDWISTPKANGYEALHTTVMSHDGRWVEIQIRSEHMDAIAERGYAAHFLYKGNEYFRSDSRIDEWLKRIREVLENPETNTLDFIDDFKLNLFDEEIYVFTPKGELKVMPRGASVLDFAMEIHSDLGRNCIGAKVNHRIEPISYRLQNGDQVEVITSAKQKPTEEWLKYVVTAKAKSIIKAMLKSERRRIVSIGRNALEQIFRRKHVEFTAANLNPIVDHYGFTSAEELFYSIGIGNFKLSAIEDFELRGERLVSRPREKTTADIELAIKNKLVSNANLWVFGKDAEAVDYNLASCCKPIPGDEVFGFVNKNKEVEIHRTNCPKAINIISKHGYPIVRTKWTRQHQIAFLTGIRISGMDDVGVVHKITHVISGDLKINMQSISLDTKDGMFYGIIKVFVNDTAHLNQLLDKLRALEGILQVSRIEEDLAAENGNGTEDLAASVKSPHTTLGLQP
ncbi:MAG: RelA/SpoT family protein [Chitinophagales bacterium]|nr:RelA/SpoT family protein [Chitinophagales bacterium]MDW8393731.1 RelA/SpoT family protein [Chitinophagales bacterium]